MTRPNRAKNIKKKLNEENKNILDGSEGIPVFKIFIQNSGFYLSLNSDLRNL